MDNRIKIFHVEDYQIVRDGVMLLSREKNFSMVGSTGKGEELLQALKTTPVDVILMDLFLDEMETNEFHKWI